jgi:hypothetical protein
VAESWREKRGGDKFEKAAKRNHKARRSEWESDDDDNDDNNGRIWQDDKSLASEPQPAK